MCMCPRARKADTAPRRRRKNFYVSCTMLSDIEIAESCQLQSITRIARKLGLKEDDLELYGRYKAKINLQKVNSSLSLP